MTRLNDDVKRFIIMELATFRTPAEVAARVGEELGIKVTAARVHEYNPRRAHGKALATRWRELFEATRQAFLERASDIPIAQKAYRLRELNDMAQKAKARGNLPLAAQLLEQAAKEMGSAYTNRRELTGRDGRDLPAQPSAVIVLPEKDVLAEQDGEAEAVARRNGGGNGETRG